MREIQPSLPLWTLTTGSFQDTVTISISWNLQEPKPTEEFLQFRMEILKDLRMCVHLGLLLKEYFSNKHQESTQTTPVSSAPL